ncbi:hypothetical protein BH09MYX1_BH09MYX1_25010 [soil metagenome]
MPSTRTTGPNDPKCTSCGFPGNETDPNCQLTCGAGCVGFYGADEDGLNVRYAASMKSRYGFDPQFPVQRYVDGLTSLKVPSRDGEHKGGGGNYLGTKNCTNPLFAQDLPDGSDLDADPLCNLKAGPRTPDLVFFAVIGGVPWQLLADAAKPDEAQKPFLSADDWKKIVGSDPAHGIIDGIDPHMTASVLPRPGLPPPTAASTTDPIHGREWTTSASREGTDLQYACTFLLPEPKDCTLSANALTCECVGAAADPNNGSPVCAATTQTRGKAYPSTRELRVAQGLGRRGIVSSICARSVEDPSRADYGYRPAMAAIVSRIAPILAGSCLPAPLPQSSDGAVTCSVYEYFAKGAAEAAACDPAHGLSVLSPAESAALRNAELTRLRAQDPKATLADVGPICRLAQLPPSAYQNGTCRGAAAAGFCYVTSTEASGGCTQALHYSPTGTPATGVSVRIACP